MSIEKNLNQTKYKYSLSQIGDALLQNEVLSRYKGC